MKNIAKKISAILRDSDKYNISEGHDIAVGYIMACKDHNIIDTKHATEMNKLVWERMINEFEK